MTPLFLLPLDVVFGVVSEGGCGARVDFLLRIARPGLALETFFGGAIEDTTGTDDLEDGEVANGTTGVASVSVAVLVTIEPEAVLTKLPNSIFSTLSASGERCNKKQIDLFTFLELFFAS